MIRTQVQLTEDQIGRLKRLAAERGVSMAALVREAVEKQLEADDRKAKWERAMKAVGIGRSGLPDLAEEHDRYLALDLEEDLKG
ncbi:MAG: CopG family transcriptional regulator [Actinomycetota bacterium]